MNNSGIAVRLEEIKALIPEGVSLVAVSKFHPVEDIREAYDAGQRLFGESRVQELLEKIPQLPSDIKWHFIGHLQTNKVKAVIGKTSLIESVDSLRLLEIIDLESRKKGVNTDILLQVHIAQEETKFGFSPEELIHFFSHRTYDDFANVTIHGLMAMATNTDNKEIVRHDFEKVSLLREKLIKEISKTGMEINRSGKVNMNILSMGMSGDWPLAVEEGSNIIRIGSAIFGERAYKVT